MGALPGDMDIVVTEVQLAHRFSYAPGDMYEIYRAGRGVSGMVYCISGGATMYFADCEVVIRKGEMMFLSADSAYCVMALEGEPYYHITVNFDISENSVLPEHDMSRMVLADSFRAGELFGELLEAWQHKRSGYRIKVRALLYRLLHSYFVNLEMENRGGEYEKLLPAIRMLDERYAEDVPVTALADMCGYSVTHFRRLFRQITGRSPSEYRINRRILRAKDMLLTNEYSVAQAAALAGFDDVNYFSRVFRKYTGKTPSGFIHENRRRQ